MTSLHSFPIYYIQATLNTAGVSQVYVERSVAMHRHSPNSSGHFNGVVNKGLHCGEPGYPI